MLRCSPIWGLAYSAVSQTSRQKIHSLQSTLRKLNFLVGSKYINFQAHLTLIWCRLFSRIEWKTVCLDLKRIWRPWSCQLCLILPQICDSWSLRALLMSTFCRQCRVSAGDYQPPLDCPDPYKDDNERDGTIAFLVTLAHYCLSNATVYAATICQMLEYITCFDANESSQAALLKTKTLVGIVLSDISLCQLLRQKKHDRHCHLTRADIVTPNFCLPWGCQRKLGSWSFNFIMVAMNTAALRPADDNNRPTVDHILDGALSHYTHVLLFQHLSGQLAYS